MFYTTIDQIVIPLIYKSLLFSLQDRIRLRSNILRAMNMDGSDRDFCKRPPRNGISQNSSKQYFMLCLSTFVTVKIWSYF